MKIRILGAAVSDFGELWNRSPRDLAKEVILKAVEESHIRLEDIDALYVGNMLSGILSNQANLGSFFADEIGRYVPAFRIEGACASGGLALHNAIQGILSKTYKTVLVLGIEKMTDHGQDDVNNALMAAASDEERLAGATFTGLYALMASSYMQQFGVSEEDLASISVKNHYHGSLNPRAQFKSRITIEDVLKSTKVADPLKLLDCSPISDGAACIVITGQESTRKKSVKDVCITASEVSTDTLSISNRKSLVSLSSVVTASKNAYKKAGITPKDIDVAEVHDCFSIAEAIAVEDLGFSKEGQGAKDIRKGKMTLLTGDIIVNSSGGLKACGHPVGATGIKQIVEIVEQLRGKAGERQVKKAKIGLTHNVGGSGAVSVIHILRS